MRLETDGFMKGNRGKPVEVGSDDLNQLRKGLAFYVIRIRKAKGLDVDYAPDRVDLDEVTRAFFKEFRDMDRMGRLPGIAEGFLRPLGLWPYET